MELKRAIIFGATGGIGQEIARSLAAAGWSLYLHFDRQEELAKKMQVDLINKYPQQDFFTLKLSFLASDEVLKKAMQQLFPVNAAIFAQGITNYDFLSSQDLAVINKIMQINLVTPIKLTSLLEKNLLKAEHSRIVYLGSVYGQQASAMESVYSASKGGLSSFAKGYSREVAASHLTVNVVAPGAVDTPMNAIFSKDVLEEVKTEIPAGRLAQPKDVAFVVENLLKAEADYLTGQTIYVDGGWLV